MGRWRKFLCVGIAAAIPCLGALLFCGCVTRTKARTEERAAYLAGQNSALKQQQAQQRESSPDVTVIGSVQNHDVPWVDGLTLAQAIATATYLGQHDPKEIVITRKGESAKIAPKLLLNGAPVPLEPGDIITIRE